MILLSSIIHNTYILGVRSPLLCAAPGRPRCISPVSSDRRIQNDITLQRTIFSRDNNRIVKSWEEFLVLQLAQLLRRRLWPVVLGQWFAKRSLLSVNKKSSTSNQGERSIFKSRIPLCHAFQLLVCADNATIWCSRN